MNVDNEKLVSIQALRGVAASMVLFAHLYPTWLGLGAPQVVPDFFNDGATGVDLFFVISGFVMVFATERFFAKPGAALQFIKRRLIRIVPLYWICTTFWLAFLVSLHGGIAVDDMSLSMIVGSYMFIPVPRPSGIVAPVLGVGWSLNIEMVFYGVFAFAVMLPRRYAVAAASLVLAGLMYAAHRDASHTLVLYDNPRIWEFIVGMVIGLIYREGLRLSPLVSAIAFGFGALIFVDAVFFEIGPAAMLGKFWAWVLSFAIMVAGLVMCKTSAKDGLLTKTAVVYGDASYSLYLTHTITLALMNLFVAGRLKATAYPVMFIVLQLFVCIAAAILIHLYIEKPVTRLIQRVVKPISNNPHPVPA